MRQILGGFHLIGIALDVAVPLPIVISEDLRIERPNAAQMTLVQQQLSSLDLYGYAKEHFETIATTEKLSNTNTMIHRTRLTESDQRYLLLTFGGNANSSYFFLNAAQL